MAVVDELVAVAAHLRAAAALHRYRNGEKAVLTLRDVGEALERLAALRRRLEK